MKGLRSKTTKMLAHSTKGSVPSVQPEPCQRQKKKTNYQSVTSPLEREASGGKRNKRTCATVKITI